MGGQVVRLAEQVGHAEAEVESGIAEVDHLVVEQDQPAVVDQHVLGAEVAMDDRVLARIGVVDQGGVKGGRLRNLAGGVPVIGLDP